MDNRKVAKKGITWTSLSTIITAVTGILRLAILTRFLEKTDFGVVSIVSLVLGLTQTFSDLGFAAAIMHKQDLARKEFSSLYWIQLIIYTLIFIVISSLSGIISVFYETPELRPLLPISLLGLIFCGIGRLYGTLLQKNFEFKTIAYRNIISALLSLILAVVLAYFGMGVYSLVLSTLFHMFIDNMWNFLAGQRQLKLQAIIDLKGSMPMVKIGLYQTGSQAIDYLASKIDVILIGKFLGMEVLGVYNLAKELLLKFISMINSIVVSVSTPFFSVNQKDRDLLGGMYCKMLDYLTTITFPIVMLMVALAKPVIIILYGEPYIEAATLVILLSVWMIEVCVHNPIGSLVVATGRTDLSFYYTIIRILINTVSVFITVNFSIQIVALGQSFSALIIFFVVFYMIIKKCTGISLLSFVRSFYKQGLICALIGIIATTFVNFNFLHLPNIAIVHLVIYGAIFFMLTLLLYVIFMRRNINELLSYGNINR